MLPSPEPQSDRPVTVSSAERRHAAPLAAIHHAALAGDFLPSLGLDFLTCVYYPEALVSPYGATLIARSGDTPIGFVTIAHDADHFASALIRARAGAVLRYIVRRTIRQPWVGWAAFELLWSVARSRPDPVKGEIVFIAVDEPHRGKGVGQMLVRATMSYLAEHRVDRCRTKTLASNAGVIAMYGRLGWHVRERFRLIGREYVTIVSPPFVANPNPPAIDPR